ncbi:hypothetical protein NIES2100_70980 [Calothrix sp. NIES-2100]|uniref:DUF6602 domain-containing protein n=1 Tax=Calothrix sp. NIES-2100 TaxID=1954172 RepID=UPI000B5E0E56|nr:hypothetical protein NIES2100_70980 [Calothrix sp. NIES-2100]
MEDYFEFVSKELQNRLNQIKEFIKKHNPTIGVLTEEILRDFLKKNLPRMVSVEQGFIRAKNGELSKQCDILIYNSHLYAPFYRLNDIVIVPEESVIAVIEVKTTINKQIFHNGIDYFENIKNISQAHTYLFIYNCKGIESIEKYLHSYNHKDDRTEFDHDTYYFLPDEITGINESFHLKKDLVVCYGRDSMGYSSYFYEGEKGTEINALQHFYLSVYRLVETEIGNLYRSDKMKGVFYDNRSSYFLKKTLSSYYAIELFDM